MQVECHPLYPQTALRAFCAQHAIQVQAYSSFGGEGQLLTEPLVLEAARVAQSSPNRVLLRWLLDQSIPVIPKSAHPERIADNLLALADPPLPPQARDLLDRLSAQQGPRKLCWDPSVVA